VYADYAQSASSSSCESEQASRGPIVLASLEAVYERLEPISKSVDSEHTVHVAKLKKNQKKKRKPRAVVHLDDEPVKQIEIIRSQPEEKPKVTANKPQPIYQPKATIEQIPAKIALPQQLCTPNPSN